MKIITFKYPLSYLILASIIIAVFSVFKVLGGELSGKHKSHSLVGSHGMVLMHDDKAGFFVSHLPLYNHPHNFQIIYKIKTSEPEIIINLLKEGMVTVLPDLFDLAKLIKGESFTVGSAFYQGHFERGGSLKLNTKVFFEQPILIKQVLPIVNSESSVIYTVPISNKLSIFAHKIQQSPSFDAIGFIHGESDELYKLKDDEGVQYLTCEKPVNLSIDAIKKSAGACHRFNFKYIETKDFN